MKLKWIFINLGFNKTEKSENNANKRKATDIFGPPGIQILSNASLILTTDNMLHALCLTQSSHLHKIPWNMHYYSAHMKDAEGKATRS